MITIDKAFYSLDKTTLNIILRSDNPSATPLSSITKVYIEKSDIDQDGNYRYNKTLSLSGTYDLLSINISADITKSNNSIVDFYTEGITTVKIEYGSNTSSYSTFDDTEFYSHKLKLINVSSDVNNIQKLSKKITTYSFLEQMLISSLSLGYLNDSKLFYNELVKLSSFGYSDLVQNNPNSEY